MMLIRTLFLFCLFHCFFGLTVVKGAITPYHSSNANGHVPNSAVPNQQTPVNQGIRIREPVDRPPELPSTHPIQYNEPSPRYERPSMLQRMRGNGENQKDKGKENVEDNPATNSKKRKQAPSHDHEASTSSKKQKSFFTRVMEHSIERQRYHNKLKTYDTLADATIALGGAAIYGGYKATKAAVNGVKKGCDAACRAAKKIKDRIKGSPENEVNSSRGHIHRFRSADESRMGRNYGFVRQPRQNQIYHQVYGAAAHAQPNPIVHQPQNSHSSAAITDENSVNNYRGNNRGVIQQRQSGTSHSAHTSSSDTSSLHSASRSRSINSRRDSNHSSGSGISRSNSVQRRHPGQ